MKNAHKTTIVWCVLAALCVAVGAEIHNGSANATRTLEIATGKARFSQPVLNSKTSPKFDVRMEPAEPLGPRYYTYSFSMARTLPPLEPSVLQAVDDVNAREGRRQLQIGIARSLVQPMIVNSATAPRTNWTTLPNGWRVLSVLVSSEGALGLRLHLESLHLPPGSKLVVYDPNNPAPDPSAISSVTLAGQRQVWTRTLFSEQAVVEAQVPPSTDVKSLSFTVSGVSHLFALPVSLGILKEGTCHNDVTCYPAYSQQASGVARIAFVSGGNTYVCSGCLIAGSGSGNGGNFFLTANHCIGNQNLASSMELFWFYQTSTCNGTPPSLSSVPTTSGGADLLATSTQNDFTLLRLRQVPPAGAFHLAWSTSILPPRKLSPVFITPLAPTNALALANSSAPTRTSGAFNGTAA